MTLTVSKPDKLGEIARLMPEGALRVPDHRRDRGKGEWDWYYQLGRADRKRVLAHCQRGGIGPDECATYAGFTYVDEWAAALVAVVLAGGRYAEREDEFMLARDLVGPVEIADICGVKPDTVYQWVSRGLLPAPWCTLSGTRLWARGEIEDWALDTGRLVAGGEVF
jgi:predicted DNA-binding transcriptional regulator AlpA